MADKIHSPIVEPKTGELTITRFFNAPRNLVWKAWSEPQHFMRWWGPGKFTAPVCKMDFRVGGVYLWCMRSPDAQDFWTTGVFREIVPFERIVYTDSFADEKGNVISASNYGLDADFPSELFVTVTFEELAGLPADKAGKTKMTLRHAGMPAGQMSEQAAQGWNESFDKLAASLK
jgi:uncharacterized protein YndB with AHSA1/START domain